MTTPVGKDQGFIIKFKGEDNQPSFNKSVLSKKPFIDTSASSLTSQSLIDPLPTTRHSDLGKRQAAKLEKKDTK